MDAALAAVTSTAILAQPLLHVQLASSTPAPAVDHARVHKFGRTTGYTTGTIEDLAADIPVGFSSKVYRFDDQVLCAIAAGAGGGFWAP